MGDQGYNKDKYDLNLLRGWQRSQLKILKRLTEVQFISQYDMSRVSGSAIHSSELGGKTTPLTRAGLMEKAGKDDNGLQLWQLNEQRVKKDELKQLLDLLKID